MNFKNMPPEKASHLIDQIGRKGFSSENLDVLFEALHSSHWSVRQEAALALRSWGKVVVEALMNRFNSGSIHQRFWVMKIIAQITGLECLSWLCKIYVSDDPNIRSHVIGAVADIPGESANQFLVEALGDDSWLNRHTAAGYLETRGHSVLKLLQKGFSEGSGDMKYWALRLLVKIVGHESLGVLRKALSSDNADLRHYAIMSMEEVREDWTDALLIECFRDTNWTNRKAAVLLLQRKGTRVISALAEALRSSDPDTVYWGIQTLVEIGEDDCIPVLGKLLFSNRSHEQIRWAVAALAELPFVRSAETLIEAVPGSGDLKTDMASALISMGAVAAGALLRFVDSPNDAVAQFAEKVLSKFDFAAIPGLVTDLKKLERSQREGFHESLRKLSSDAVELILKRERTTVDGVCLAASSIENRGSLGLTTISIKLCKDELRGDQPLAIKTSKRRVPSFPTVDEILRTALDTGASDVHVKVGFPPIFRIEGALKQTDLPIVCHESILDVIESVTTKDKFDSFLTDQELDVAYEIQGVSRFRVNCYCEQNGYGTAFRVIPSRILTLSELSFPAVLRDLCNLRQGLVLVTGPTGSGKSTTIAAMIDYINSNREEHIITIEDPIEFIHPNKRSVITYRELGTHTKSFSKALRASLREDPDVILIGEMRDLETIQLAITAAETGHLVFSTLHTTTAAESIDRILNIFPASMHNLVKKSLASELRAIISQLLIPSLDGRRTAVLEILTKTYAVANLIREEKLENIDQAIIAGRKVGMQSRDDHLCQLCRNGSISTETAMIFCHDKQILRNMLSAKK